MTRQQPVHLRPGEGRRLRAATEPLAPDGRHFVVKPRERRVVPSDAEIRVVPEQLARERDALRLDIRVPVHTAPVSDAA